MYRRRRPSKSYAQIGRPVVGFYTKDGKHRPITAKTPRKITPFHLYGVTVSPRKAPVESDFLEPAISYVFSQLPLVKEIRTSYFLADALYKNWSLIAQYYDIYKRRGGIGLANAIGTDIMHEKLASIQADIAWATIGSLIPQEYHNTSKRIFGRRYR